MSNSNTTLSDQALGWVAETVHPEAGVLSVRRLHGGISSLVYEVRLNAGGVETAVVLRQFHDAEWLREQPDLVVHEAESLRRASRIAGVRTPKLLGVDETGSRCGMPAVLMSRLEGTVVLESPDTAKWVDGMAQALARIHAAEADDFPWSFAPYSDAATLDASFWSKIPGMWREAAGIVSGARPQVATRFIHRDYHPANILWSGGEVSGVVDWVNGCVGPAGIDVGHCRVNLSQLYDVQTADAFLSSYQSYAGASFTYEPYWDLVTLIDFAPPEVYAGWTALGVTGLTKEMMSERLDLYLMSVLNRVSSARSSC